MRELDVIRAIGGLLPAAPEEVLVPVGDDCAVVRFGEAVWVAAADMLVEGHHFLPGRTSPEDVGYKAVAVNVSDVAAMGGVPRFVLCSGGAPEAEAVLRCFRGVVEACAAFGVYPLGGDTTRAGALTVDVAILGEVPGGEPVLRSGAVPGDLLAVTGELGTAAAGLLALQRGEGGFGRLVRRHLRPEPRVREGLEAALLGVHAMIDLSDGLATDAGHLCERSGVGCRIDLLRLPVAGDVRRLAGEDAEVLAATGGEDYELLISAPEQTLQELARRISVPLTVVGEVVEGGEVSFHRGGEPVEGLAGWDHFRA
ncbi:thiamine-monophosphate kinase [Rubrobacter xylanophilus]|uniref:Thiamine-monophosphate kinase n=1 Tax=Rubrobacter xylanophilus TaxID=49319 RepID=A0A510HJK6_9ACTN|nr:thiamine-phosphate kinase [Rubrobacter xylanophilus]BBL80088.1 thiamine-monophosphate kinase [Rubrobacter xylanophilus]